MSGGLAVTMAGLIAASKGFGGWQTIRLPRGLLVSVRVRSDKTEMKPQRSGSRPSLIELRTIVTVLPYPLTMDQVVYEFDAAGVLCASWVPPEQLL